MRLNELNSAEMLDRQAKKFTKIVIINIFEI